MTREFYIRAMTKTANPAALAAGSLGVLGLMGLGGSVGHAYGQKQKKNGEEYSFGPKQLGSLMLPGGTSYQIGRALAHGKDKKAADTTPVDSQEKALSEVEKNKKDSTSEMKDLFKNTGKATKQVTKTMDKVLPGKTEKETGNNPLLKAAFAQTVEDLSLPYSPGHSGVMFRSFRDELEKIASTY